MRYKCAHCGKTADRPADHINRSRKHYCGRRCFGLARRTGKTKTERVAKKRLYDLEYRRTNLETIKAKKHAHHLSTYDPEKERIKRKRRMPSHVAYCQRPEYRKWKSEYDRSYRAKKLFGPFAEAAKLVVDLNREIKARMTNHEIKWQNLTANKAQFRRRQGKEETERSRPRHRNRRRSDQAALG